MEHLLNNSITVNIVDKSGRKIDDRAMVNTAYAELYNEPFIIIDWKGDKDVKPSVDEIMSPVEYKGITYQGDMAWGSAVKRGRTIGLTHDLGVDFGFVKSTEDGQRVQRWLFAQGINGGFKADSLKVKIVKPGKKFMGHLCEDGFGYISNRFREYISGDKVKLGRARETYSFWQRIPFSEKLWDEFKPRVEKMIVDLSDPLALLYDWSHSSFDEKKALADIDTEMVQHPYVANALARSCSDMFFRSSTSLPAKGCFRVAAPTEYETAVLPGHSGKLVMARYPIDSNSSIQAIVSDAEKSEMDRIANLEVVQYSIHSDQLFSKGCLGIVDDLGDYDIVLCSEDIKMGIDEINDLRRLSEIELTNAIVPFTTVYSKGSACGVNAKWAKDLLGLDHDGDMPVFVDCNKLPVLWDSVKSLKPGTSSKLHKTKSEITSSSRAEMIFKSMSNLVGFASNVASMSFVVKDREALAQHMGFKSEETLNDRLNYFIKCGTDGFKTSIDLVKIEKQVAALQNNLLKLIGGAPWCHWSGHADAFRRFVPPIAYDNGQGHWADEEGKTMDKNMAKLALKPYMDGTIGEISRRILPDIQNILNAPIKTQPLTSFRRWATRVDEMIYASAAEIVQFHNARVKRVNWYDPESISAYKIVLRREVDAWLSAEGLDRKTAACALWAVCHSSRSEDSSAACVFIAFPEECLWIIEKKPGLSGDLNTVLTGLNFQLPGINNLSVDVDIVDVEIIKSGKTLVRKGVVALVDGQKQPGSGYPQNMIAMVALNTDQPKCGHYHATIEQSSAGAWKCQLD